MAKILDANAAKEAYFTASQGQLIWARFRKNRTSIIAAWFLGIIILAGFFAPFVSPYDPTIAGRDKDYVNGAPQIPQFCDSNGCSWAPFIHPVEMKLNMSTLRREPTVNEDKRLYMTFFSQGWEYSFIDWSWDLPGDSLDGRVKALTFTTHLFGLDGGKIHLFGTDGEGKDVFSVPRNLDIDGRRHHGRADRFRPGPLHWGGCRLFRRLD